MIALSELADMVAAILKQVDASSVSMYQHSRKQSFGMFQLSFINTPRKVAEMKPKAHKDSLNLPAMAVVVPLFHFHQVSLVLCEYKCALQAECGDVFCFDATQYHVVVPGVVTKEGELEGASGCRASLVFCTDNSTAGKE